MDKISLVLLCLSIALPSICAMPTKPEVEVYNVNPQPSNTQVQSDIGQELNLNLGVANALLSALNANGNADQESSASSKRSAGYGGGSYGGGGGSIIGSTIGGAVGGILRSVLRSLTGIGIKLGVNLNNEFYQVPEYNNGGYGGGAYSNNYETVQRAPIAYQNNVQDGFQLNNLVKY